MRIVDILLLLPIICCAVSASVVYSPFTKETFTYNDDDFEIVEGDILVTKSSARNGLRDPKRLWPYRIIPYKVGNNFSMSVSFFRKNNFIELYTVCSFVASAEMGVLMRAIRSFYEKTCIRFVPATSFHKRYVSIDNVADGCWSNVGYYDHGVQVIIDWYGCHAKIFFP